MDLGDVRKGIAQNLATVEGLRVHAFIPDDLLPPAAIVGYPDVWTFGRTMGRGQEEAPQLEVLVLVGAENDRVSSERLDAYVTATGDTSIREAIERDKTLGGACDDLRVSRAYDFGKRTVAGSEVLGCRFAVHLIG